MFLWLIELCWTLFLFLFWIYWSFVPCRLFYHSYYNIDFVPKWWEWWFSSFPMQAGQGPVERHSFSLDIIPQWLKNWSSIGAMLFRKQRAE